MKKVSVLFAALFVSIASFAQPQAGSFGVEMNINFGTTVNVYSSWGGGIIMESNFPTDAVRARYFLTDNMALRGIFGFTRVSLQEGHTTTNNPRITWETGNTRFGFSPGFEYHITKFERGSVYFGGDFSFDFMNTTHSSPPHFNSESTVFGYGLNAFTGVDYYVTKNLYLGAELSFGFMAREVNPRSTSTNEAYWKSSDIAFRAIPALRVGWTF